MNIEIVRTFVRLRRLHDAYRQLARRLDELEGQYDSQFNVVSDAIRERMAPPSVAVAAVPHGLHDGVTAPTR